MEAVSDKKNPTGALAVGKKIIQVMYSLNILLESTLRQSLSLLFQEFVQNNEKAPLFQQWGLSHSKDVRSIGIYLSSHVTYAASIGQIGITAMLQRQNQTDWATKLP